MHATQAIQMRPDVRRVVEAEIVASLPDVEWADYERAKRAISAVCGWYAPAALVDEQQYMVAVRVYRDAVFL